MVLNFKLNVLLNFISVYFVFYISFDLFLSETKIYSTKICEFFVGSSRPPYWFALAEILLANGDEKNLILPKFARHLSFFFSSAFWPLRNKYCWMKTVSDFTV